MSPEIAGALISIFETCRRTKFGRQAISRAAIEPDAYEAPFYEDRAEIVRRDRSLTTTLEVVVSSEDDAEMRRVSITNHGARTREIQITSYAEICLASQAADSAHPAFSNLFVETEFVADLGALLATRRRQSDERSDGLGRARHRSGGRNGRGTGIRDRPRAVHRARLAKSRNPVSIIDGRPLRKTVGSVLDPVMSLRRTVRIPPGATSRVVFSTIVAPTREQVLDLADKYRGAKTFRAHAGISRGRRRKCSFITWGSVSTKRTCSSDWPIPCLYSDASLRPSSDALSRSTLERSALWAQGISGDMPIVLVRIDETEDIEIIRQLLRAHEYWRMKQLSVDVVIINEKPPSYAQELQGSLEALVRGSRLRLSPDTSRSARQHFPLAGRPDFAAGADDAQDGRASGAAQPARHVV